ncbi:MAG: L-threonylcarbamoyladenylate synthase [Blastocatellia bacterium]|nr:L-threonylcarbamoyladenylate synthase [Blastocatellia bacterium]
MIVPYTEETLGHAAKLIANGGVIAFRTDTFYGLGANPLNSNAVVRIKKLKDREGSQPILLLIGDPSDVDHLILEKSEDFELVARSFWPGPLTIIGRADSKLSDELTAGTGTVGVRLPNDEEVRVLVRVCGGALTATSANLSGDPPARSAEQVADYFPTGIDLIIDGGEVVATEPSTVLDLSKPAPRVIRKGAVSQKTLEGVLGVAL